MKKIIQDKKVFITIIAVIIGIIVLVIISKAIGNKRSGKNGTQGSNDYGSKFAVETKQAPLNPDEVSPISGLKCKDPQNKDRRPIAVMLASDKSVRPLSGNSEADLVVEMPVITGQITRLMAVFVCNSPSEIGSIRSTRHDYISLAKGMDAMLAHWGGSHFALEYLKNKNTVPDLDGLALEGEKGVAPFWRKDTIPRPDNGFATYDDLLKKAKEFKFRTENYFEGYPHRQESALKDRGTKGELVVGFPAGFDVKYMYDPQTNTYLRFWAGVKDVDNNNNEQIAPKNVLVLFATSRQIEGQYNDVDIEGEGELHAFIEGKEIIGKWQKEKKDCVIGSELVCVSSSKLKFLDDKGEEIQLIPGQIWVEVLEPGQKLKWTSL